MAMKNAYFIVMVWWQNSSLKDFYKCLLMQFFRQHFHSFYLQTNNLRKVLNQMVDYFREVC